LLEAGVRELVIQDTDREGARRLVELLQNHGAGAKVIAGPADPSDVTWYATQARPA
jgi:hypothetical protein